MIRFLLGFFSGAFAGMLGAAVLTASSREGEDGRKDHNADNRGSSKRNV